MPLRVAEVNGWLKAVNECSHCPYARQHPGKPWRCEHHDLRMKEHEFGTVQIGFIPVWCPLPEPNRKMYIGVDVASKEGDRTGKMRGLHPENIIWDDEPIRPIDFIVEDVECDGSVEKYITIKPEFPSGFNESRMDYAALRKDDCFRVGESEYWVSESPASLRIKITPGPDIRKGDRLIVIQLARKET